MTSNIWDYIIVGAGASGCVLANRLSENPKHKVLLLEAGGADSLWQFKIPVLQAKSVRNPKFDWTHKHESKDFPFGLPSHVWSAGKVLGGGTSINGLIYVRGTPQDYDKWESLGNKGWGFKDVLPFFKKAETNVLAPDISCGSSGPMQVVNQNNVHFLSHEIVKAASELGITHAKQFENLGQERSIYFQTNQIKGMRCSSARAYLHPIKKRENLCIITNAQVSKLILKEKLVVGVEYIKDGKLQQMYSSKEVILSCGAIGSPKILLLSGIGEKEHLNTVNIAVQHDLSGVGKNLQEHPAIIIQAQTKIPSLNKELSGFNRYKNGLRWLLTRNGPLTTPVSQVGVYIKGDSELDSPNLQIDFTPMGFVANAEGVQINKNSTVMFAPTLVKPKSRGEIRLSDNNPISSPRIIHSYFSDPSDLEQLIIGGKYARSLLSSQTFNNYLDQEIMPGSLVNNDEEWKKFVLNNAVCCWHASGTCKMGQDKDAVVDSRLKVHGIQGLRVADASIMPEIVGANTTATCIMIGEKAADLILQDAIV